MYPIKRLKNAISIKNKKALNTKSKALSQIKILKSFQEGKGFF